MLVYVISLVIREWRLLWSLMMTLLRQGFLFGNLNSVNDSVHNDVFQNDFLPETFVKPVPTENGVKKKCLSKTVKKTDQPVLLTVGEDVCLNDIVLTNAMTLVRRFGGRKFNSNSLNGWATLA